MKFVVFTDRNKKASNGRDVYVGFQEPETYYEILKIKEIKDMGDYVLHVVEEARELKRKEVPEVRTELNSFPILFGGEVIEYHDIFAIIENPELVREVYEKPELGHLEIEMGERIDKYVRKARVKIQKHRFSDWIANFRCRCGFSVEKDKVKIKTVKTNEKQHIVKIIVNGIEHDEAKKEHSYSRIKAFDRNGKCVSVYKCYCGHIKEEVKEHSPPLSSEYKEFTLISPLEHRVKSPCSTCSHTLVYDEMHFGKIKGNKLVCYFCKEEIDLNEFLKEFAKKIGMTARKEGDVICFYKDGELVVKVYSEVRRKNIAKYKVRETSLFGEESYEFIPTGGYEEVEELDVIIEIVSDDPEFRPTRCYIDMDNPDKLTLIEHYVATPFKFSLTPLEGQDEIETYVKKNSKYYQW